MISTRCEFRLAVSLFIILFTAPALSFAQRFTISGYIRDAATGESLIGASVFDKKTSSGSAANTFGYYSISLKTDSIKLIFSYVGYEPLPGTFFLSKDTIINVSLSPQLLDEVVVKAGRTDAVDMTQMSSVTIPVQQIKELPAFLGEVDVLKVLQLLPGVQSGNEGSSGIYVHGGGPDQNLILLDGVPIYNVSHLFGFFSVFNADAINHVELIKGGFPARFGGRLSSVIDVSMKDGNMNKVKGEGSIGLVSSKISVEGPIKKDKASFIVSARRTYIDLIARPIIKKATEGEEVFGYFFYDFNTKLNYKLNERNRLFFSVYAGDDKAYGKFDYNDNYGGFKSRSKNEFGLKWGNVITAWRWNHVINQKLFSNVTGIYSRYRFDVFDTYDEWRSDPGGEERNSYHSQYISGIRDWGLKLDFDYLPHPDHYVRFGANAIEHKFTPGVYTYRSTEESDTTLGAKPTNAREFAFYAEDDFKISTRLKLNVGVHASAFYVDHTFYHALQPRISARYLIDESWSLKASYARMAQFIHLLTNAGLGLPTDLWVPATKRIPPQQANQVALGAVKTVGLRYDFSVEGYYKTMDNIIEYRDGATYFNLDNDWQDKVVVGNGRSYGTEFLFRKNAGSMTGWIGYTLSWTDRQFDEINDGKRFPYKYDRRHDISVAMTHEWNKRIDFSMAWVYGTGNAVSLPVATYQGYRENHSVPHYYYGSAPVQYYDRRNNFRMNSYHRLDLSFSFWKIKKWGQRKWTIALYNAYNRKNPFFMDIGTDEKGKKQVFQYTLFPVIPSITYSFKF